MSLHRNCARVHISSWPMAKWLRSWFLWWWQAHSPRKAQTGDGISDASLLPEIPISTEESGDDDAVNLLPMKNGLDLGVATSYGLGATHVKFAASSLFPVPVYRAYCG